MNVLVSRSFAALLVVGIGLAAATGPAAGARRTAPDPTVTPTPAPLYDVASPPPTVDAPGAIDACSNDVFLAYRAVPMPVQHEVTICGLVTDGATAAAPSVRTARGPSFFVDADGTQPIAVTADGPSFATRLGDVVIVRGRYHRDNGGGEGIDSVHTAPGRGWPFDGYVMVNGTIYR